MASIDQLIQSIDARIDELQSEIASLQAARSTLVSNSAAPPPPPTALAERFGADRDQVLVLLRDLEQARRIRRTGQRRATRWHAITDEDRIRERAAELASRSRDRHKPA